jgi:hypothetical protein
MSSVAREVQTSPAWSSDFARVGVEWVAGLIQFATERGLTRIEATADGVAEWTDYVLELGQGQLMNEIASWMTGVNRNVEGKQKARIMRYRAGILLTASTVMPLRRMATESLPWPERPQAGRGLCPGSRFRPRPISACLSETHTS